MAINMDVWSQIALHQKEINSIEQLWKLKLIGKNPALIFLVAYFKARNAILKHSLKNRTLLKILKNGYIKPLEKALLKNTSYHTAERSGRQI